MELSHQIAFDVPSGYARRWYPLGRKGLIVLDPSISFGKPTLVSRGIATANIYDYYLGEEENLAPVCSWMNLTKKEVAAAVAYERQLAAA